MFSVDRIPMHFVLSRGGLQISANEPVKEQVWHMAMTILESPYSLGQPVTVKGNLGVTASLDHRPKPAFRRWLLLFPLHLSPPAQAHTAL